MTRKYQFLAVIAALALASAGAAQPQAAPSSGYTGGATCNGIIAILIGLVAPAPRRC